MRQAVIVGARPMYTKGKRFPQVPLGAGNWRVESENHEDSVIRLTYTKRHALEHGEASVPQIADIKKGERLIIQGPSCVFAEIVEAGKELYVSVFAYAMNGEV